MTKQQIERHKRSVARRLARVQGRRSQRQFARDVGVSQQNMNRWIHGALPTVEFLIRLHAEEGVDLNWLLLGQRRSA